MKLDPVESSNVDSIGYEPSTKMLYVKFKSGGTYSYADVSQEKYDALMAADSHGKHLHRHIKPKHDCVKCR